MANLEDITNMQPISLDVLAEKYLKPGEHSAEDIYRRVAKALASVEPKQRALWQDRFLDNLRRGAIGAGRIMSAAGTDIEATLINCFVQPVGDCIQGKDKDGYPGITRLCVKPQRPCAGAVESAMTSPGSDPKAHA